MSDFFFSRFCKCSIEFPTFTDQRKESRTLGRNFTMVQRRCSQVTIIIKALISTITVKGFGTIKTFSKLCHSVAPEILKTFKNFLDTLGRKLQVKLSLPEKLRSINGFLAQQKMLLRMKQAKENFQFDIVTSIPACRF